jgi:cytidine deaminase
MAKRDIPVAVLAELRAHARRAAEHNYARYSGVLVVAAVETVDGRYFGGTNVEVANYTLTKHAEEMAILAALGARPMRKPSTGDRWLKTLYVCGVAPCGSCRQFAAEWATPQARCVIDLPGEDDYIIEELRRLLPVPFTAADVGRDKRPARPAGGALPSRG